MNYYHFEEVEIKVTGREKRQSGAPDSGKAGDKVEFVCIPPSLVLFPVLFVFFLLSIMVKIFIVSSHLAIIAVMMMIMFFQISS